ncbi:M18 family aminopeptidase [Corynebacterium variabile]|uniref:M18 family aminopeptidase n=1 Tax=Corynebacterium variabile TaxID=1727 RepID=A0A3B9QV81_9CORY|nr:M18 family aminopeptidase [Corynebacterium variabile]MDN6240908.1 M18 family aminopeptidase [Corynebacterium variabile]MDN6661802.1 M18 family aminopeptidase [Corynebacterium variabile]MDN6676086.1 M18 family aminopeptidase [Corynebacterium variabile]MDN6812947.1 M18 family aminopeptidase [Corynebacterium variabile]HAF72885.1 M18 family aminopeptidase [Corynebacterium variabile]
MTDPAVPTSATALARRFADFIAASPSSYHAAAEVARRLADAGYVREDERMPWGADAVSPGGHYIVRGGAVIAWDVPAQVDPTTRGFRIVGSHTDSPGLKLKPLGDLPGTAGWKQAAVEIYGGAILASWLDRELRLAGRVVLTDGTEKLVATGPVLRVPHLAIHLDRNVNADLTLDRQMHMQPVFAVGEDAPTILDVVARATSVDPDDIVAHDLITVDAQHGEIFGAQEDFLAAGRMDNLSSVFTSLEALLAASGNGKDIRVLAAFDHEEIGSATTSGAAGPVLEDVLVRVASSLGADASATRAMYARSACVSADAAHSVHPNFAGKHDGVNRPVMNAGPVLKVNANQRYATDAVTAAAWRRACATAGVPDQVFAGNNDVPCGSTIGPITATRLGIPTVDVGIPLLSMHSAREMAGVKDIAWFTDALKAWWEL